LADSQGYVLGAEDVLGLVGLRAGQQTMAEFARHIGAPEAAQDYENKVQWLDGFMDRIGATEMLGQMQRDSGYSIETGQRETQAEDLRG
jgi:hypothetical protein